MTTKNYHYEWVAYTDNLCYGRQKIAQDRSHSWVRYCAETSGRGCYVIKRIRVYDINK